MSAYEYLSKRLQAEMYTGNMHECIRDVGRLAGGYLASGSLSANEEERLKQLVMSMANNPFTAERKHVEALEFGKTEPIQFDEVPVSTAPNQAMEWDSTICEKPEFERKIEPKIEPKIDSPGDDNYKIIDTNWIQDEEIPDPGESWDSNKDLVTYLSTLYNKDEYVGYVTESFIPEGEDTYLPTKGSYSWTAGELIEKLALYNGDIGYAMGDYQPIAGAWIRFNPFNGKGVKDENVTAYRYALVESDDIPIPRQYAIIKKLELPVVMLVHSGGRSLHAIVKIDAKGYDEYKERVNFLYKICEKNGLKVDVKNRNPSRLSRLPGVTRKGKKQFIVDSNIGSASWEDWKTHIEDVNDDLPEIEAEDKEDPNKEPELAPAIIDGILRQGHKLLISGPSKAGKSFALLQLCIATANGGDWFGHEVTQGRVLYVNLELDPKSCKHRLWKIRRAIGEAQKGDNLDIWNLRGHAVPLGKLVPKLIRRAMKKRYTMIVIDPLYKVLDGDENSAGDITKSFNEIDKLCKALNASLVVCHHHSKGEQGHKASRDRSSGSGVFARDPDAVLDLIELEISEDLKKSISNRWECDAMIKAFDYYIPNWRTSCPQDDAIVADKLAAWAESTGSGDTMREARGPAIAAAEMATGWRLEKTLREFPFAKPQRFYYRYPVHIADKDQLLSNTKVLGQGRDPSNGARNFREENPDYVKLTEEQKAANKAAKNSEKYKDFNMHFEQLAFETEDGKIRMCDLMKKTDLRRDQVKKLVSEIPSLSRDGNGIVWRHDPETEEKKDGVLFIANTPVITPPE